MTTLLLNHEPSAKEVRVSSQALRVELADGRTIVIPLDWYPRLREATPKERNNWSLLGGGYAIEWPDLDEHIGVEGILAGRKSGESKASLECWREAPLEKARRRMPRSKRPRARPRD